MELGGWVQGLASLATSCRLYEAETMELGGWDPGTCVPGYILPPLRGWLIFSHVEGALLLPRKSCRGVA
jgi:hypothetical protein